MIEIKPQPASATPVQVQPLLQVKKSYAATFCGVEMEQLTMIENLVFVKTDTFVINISGKSMYLFTIDHICDNPLPPWSPSESGLRPTCTPKHTHLSLDHSSGT